MHVRSVGLCVMYYVLYYGVGSWGASIVAVTLIPEVLLVFKRENNPKY
jgi:hypothetical protein